MAQHFLLDPACRRLTISDLARLREATAYAWFRSARWPSTDGKPTCPECGNLRCYEMSRARFKCSARECRKVFSVTSGTAFASRKLLLGLNRTKRVNHSKAYATADGDNTNFVESFFSRVERSYVGVHHRFSVKYLDWYVADLAWKEDHRGRGNRWQTLELLLRALAAPTSRYLCGYWQGNSPPDLVWEKPAPRAT